MSDELFDFGFTLVDENELEAVQQATAQVQSVSSNVEETQQKLDKLFNAIQPLLTNLKANPEKEYILWQLIVLRRLNSSKTIYKTSTRDNHVSLQNTTKDDRYKQHHQSP